MRNFFNKQLKGKDEQLATLVKDFEMARNWQKKVEIAKKNNQSDPK
jgi:hypothetical protein